MSVDPGQIIMNKTAGVATPEKMSNEQWVQEQRQDPAISKTVELYKAESWVRIGQDPKTTLSCELCCGTGYNT